MTKSLLTEGSLDPNTDSGTVGQTPTYYSWYTDVNYKSTWGEETPDFYKKKRAGVLLPFNNYQQFDIVGQFSGYRSYDWWNDSQATSYYTSSYYPHSQTVMWSILGVTDVTSTCVPTPAQTMLRATTPFSDVVISKAAAKIISSTHDTLTSLSELKKTIGLVSNAISNLIRLLTSTPPDKWARYWLELRYGWRTLLYDLQAISQALDELDKVSEFYTARAGLSLNETSQAVIPAANYHDWWGQMDILDSWDISLRGNAVSKVKPPSFGGNVAVTAWELVRLSFVIDWFIDIGSKIAYWTSLGRPPILFGLGTKITFHRNVKWRKTGQTNPYKQGTSGKFSTLTEFRYESDCTTTGFLRAPVLGPDILPSIVSLPLSIDKIRDLLAILLSARTRL